MRAILIDSENSEVREIEIDEASTLQELYKFLKCEMVEHCERPIDIGTIKQEEGTYIDLWIDEEGRLKPVTCGFELDGEPFAGLGVITGGADAEGDTISLPKSITVEIIKANIRFIKEPESHSLEL